MEIHPLKFKPIPKRRIWGGRTLETMFGKELPPDEPIGESWELADLEEGQSVVAEGPAAGRTLGELVREWGTDLLGRAELFEGRFPLLIKFLDARENLSVQVHPDRAYVERHDEDARLKNEAWYVLDADPGGCIYRGLEPGVDRAQFREAIEAGTVESLMHRIDVHAGESYYLPSGTLHALGAGVVVAEIQTPSDTTFRVFDWNRVDRKTGKPRRLHVEQALECIHFGPEQEEAFAARPSLGAGVWSQVERLVACPSFVVDRAMLDAGAERDIPYAEPVVWMVLEGRGAVRYGRGDHHVSFQRGDTLLLPAALERGRVAPEGECVWLEVTLPGADARS